MNGHCNHLALQFSVCVKERQDRLPTMYWLPKLHKKKRIKHDLLQTSSCTTTELSKLLTSCLIAVKNHVIRYCEKDYERSGKNLFWSIKRDDFYFDIVNFPFLDGDVPRSTSYGVYISQLIRFARVSRHVVDFNARNKSLTAKLLQQGYRYHKLRKTFSKFYRRHYELVSKFNVGLKTLLHQGLSEPEFYGDLVYKFKKIVGRADFSDQFRKIIVRYKRIAYNINILPQSACLVFYPITVNNFASLFNCTPVGRASDSMMAPT